MPSETTSVTGVSTEPSDVVSGEMPEGSSSREVMAKRGSTALGSWLVAIDLDGTTIDEAGDASRGVVTQLRRIERVGHHLLIATGRSAATTLPVLDRIGAWPEYVVCSNGAVILQRDGAAPSGITGSILRVSMRRRCWQRSARIFLRLSSPWRTRPVSTATRARFRPRRRSC